MKNIISKKITDLKTHPMNEQIYTADESVDNLKESIKDRGQLDPITITDDGVIISGHRRVKALTELGYETVEATVKSYESEEEQVMDLIEFNNTRVKTKIEVFNEISHYKEMFSRRRGQRTDLEKESFKGATKELIAKALGIGATNIIKIEFIHETNPQLLNAIDKGETTINRAYKTAQAIRTGIEKAKENQDKSIDILLHQIPDVSIEIIGDVISEDTQAMHGISTKLPKEVLALFINIIENSNAKFCQCPNCSTILDFIELLKNHRYEEEENYEEEKI